ncbi:hypothetical protein KAJ83_09670 [Marivibrio halodurans]|uniref:Uncharacterized protein n=1 Tax=Marivibrio halodurans TaxID=2039722 RepID=A0A8J7V2K9_9PROT|nr:hypothetical protein [Marivibrio halodurans]MBP5857276.1 hypothetical protein [Marivibrio halodurans]
MEIAIHWAFAGALAYAAAVLILLPFGVTAVLCRLCRLRRWVDYWTGGWLQAAAGWLILPAFAVIAIAPALLPILTTAAEWWGYAISGAVIAAGFGIAAWANWALHDGPYDEDAAFWTGCVYIAVGVVSALLVWLAGALVGWGG